MRFWDNVIDCAADMGFALLSGLVAACFAFSLFALAAMCGGGDLRLGAIRMAIFLLVFIFGIALCAARKTWWPRRKP